MLFLLLVIGYIIALGAGSQGMGFLLLCTLLIPICMIVLYSTGRGIFLCFLSLGIGILGWRIGLSSHQEQMGNWEKMHMMTKGYTQKSTLIGKIDSLAYSSDYTSTYRLNIDSIDSVSTIKNNLNIFVEIPKNLHIVPHDVLAFTGKINPLLSYPFVGFEKYAWENAVYGKVYLPTFTQLSKGKLSYFESIQKWSETVIFRGFPRDTAALLLGMTLGNTNLLSRGLKEDFKLSGMTHILVVSGSNIAFVILLILFFLKYTRAPLWMRIGIVTLFVILYGCLVGWDAPVVRATCMGLITYIGLQFHAKVSSVTILLFLCAIYISVYPFALLFDAGFGLSFGATLGILLFHTKIEGVFAGWGIFRFIGTVLGVTLGATLGSLPVLIYHFGTLSIGGILANILIASLLGPLLFLSVGYLALASTGFSHLYYPGLILYLPAKIILIITDFFSGGYQLVINDSLKTPIALFLIVCGIYIILINERDSLRTKVKIALKHQEKNLIP